MHADLPRTPALGYDAAMDTKPRLRGCLHAVGWAFAALAVLFAYVALTALIERMRFGSGLMFADVEILTAVTVFFGVLGGWLLWFTRSPKEPDECREDFLAPPRDATPQDDTDTPTSFK